MSDPVVENLVLDLLEWLAIQDRSYEETMDAWRTSCPKLPVWEDATAGGLVALEVVSGRRMVRITNAGLSRLQQHRREPRSTVFAGLSFRQPPAT